MASADKKEFMLPDGRAICIHDGIFDLAFRSEVYEMAIRSPFRLGWEDTSVIEHAKYRYFFRELSQENLNELGLLMHLAKTPVFAAIKGLNLAKAVLNLSTPCDVFFPHTHPQKKVLLYYVNLEWQVGWHGETLYFDESLQNIVLATPYTPGRIAVFDGSIPHSIRPQSHAGAAYRFTLGLFFD